MAKQLVTAHLIVEAKNWKTAEWIVRNLHSIPGVDSLVEVHAVKWEEEWKEEDAEVVTR